MSESTAASGAAPAEQDRYFCHTCNSEVEVKVNDDDQEPHCLRCGDCFVELLETPPPQPQPRQPALQFQHFRINIGPDGGMQTHHMSSFDDQKFPDIAT
jgi:DNA-directed RNA polymerase subunit RPC12/RpoP